MQQHQERKYRQQPSPERRRQRHQQRKLYGYSTAGSPQKRSNKNVLLYPKTTTSSSSSSNTTHSGWFVPPPSVPMMMMMNPQQPHPQRQRLLPSVPSFLFHSSIMPRTTATTTPYPHPSSFLYYISEYDIIIIYFDGTRRWNHITTESTSNGNDKKI